MFRGCAPRFLYRLADWRLWPAVRVPALFFTVGHQYRAQDPASTAGIFAIMALGDGLAKLARVLTSVLSIVPAVCRDRLPGFRPPRTLGDRSEWVPVIDAREK